MFFFFFTFRSLATLYMKSLLLIRHAKSSWENFSVPDFDRPLNERGKKDAPMIAERLIIRKVQIDGFVSSPAKRAKKTAQAFAEKFGRNKETILYRDELYEAGTEQFYEVIADLDDAQENVAIFSHNPGITSFANEMQVAKIDEMPTCSVFAIHAPVKSWKEFRQALKEFWFFEYPKKIQP